MATPSELLTIPDYEAYAKESMPPAQFAQLMGDYGAHDWTTNTNNLDAFESIKLRPRVLVDTSRRNLSTEVLGQKMAAPVMLAPIGTHQRTHPDGELASARAAGAFGTVFVLSTSSTFSIEEVADVATGPLWFMGCIFQDRRISEALIHRAQDAGYTGLVLTVDNLGARYLERGKRYPYTPEEKRVLKNLVSIDIPNVPTGGNFTESFDASFTWADLEWVRSVSSMPVIMKGIQTAEDARRCVGSGVDALIVSNHGGFAGQGVRGTLEVLPEVVDAVGDAIEVYIDGGVRRGTDVLKALSIGAKAVLIGRPMLWGLLADGEAGVKRVLEILRDELDVAMGLCGSRDVNKVDRSLVTRPGLGSPDGLVDQLERLAGLVERGYLTRGEFEARKAKLLGS